MRIRKSVGGALFVNNNRKKRTSTINLKHTDGGAAVTRLIGTADVMRLDAAERIALGFAAVNPRIVHCVATGFGSAGPYRDCPAFDDIIQAASGLAGLGGLHDDTPRFVPTILADKTAALHVVYVILAALFARERGGDGPFQVEMPMFETMVAFLMNEHPAAATFSADGATGYPRMLSPDQRPFQTADRWIAVLPDTEAQWRRFLAEIRREAVCDEPWFDVPRQRQAHIGTL